MEGVAHEWLAGLGYVALHRPDIGPEGQTPERGSRDEELLAERLRGALTRPNPHMLAKTLRDALRTTRPAETLSPIQKGRRLHRCLAEGAPVEVAWEDDSIGDDAIQLIDFDNI